MKIHSNLDTPVEQPVMMIVQLSDLHYGVHEDKEKNEQDFANDISKIYIKDRIRKQCQDLNPEAVIIIMNGDYVATRNSSIKDQILSSYNKFVAPLEGALDKISSQQKKDNPDGTPLRVRKIFIPGNHDADRKKGNAKLVEEDRIKYSSRALEEFYEAIEDINKDKHLEDRYYTPRDMMLRLSLKDYEVLFWLIDSAYLCGSIKTIASKRPKVNLDAADLDRDEEEEFHFAEILSYYDPVTVSEDSLLRCAKEVGMCDADKKQLRIAAIHHSPINPTRRADKYLFTNDVDFLNSLYNNKFNILLHGHHHESTVLHFEYLSKINTEKNRDSKYILPHIESGVTSIGTKSLWPDNKSARGYNTIIISEVLGSSLIKIDVNDFSLKTDDIGGSRSPVPDSKTIRFTQTTQSIVDYEDTKGRMETLHRIHSLIYSNTPLTEFDQEAKISVNAAKNLSREKRHYHSSQRIYGSYTIGVMSPGDWLRSGFRDVFNPYVAINFIRASQYSCCRREAQTSIENKYGYILPVFRFSSWLSDAIYQCCEKGRNLSPDKIFAKIRESQDALSLEEREFFLRASKRIERLSGDVIKSSSYSYWALNYTNKKLRLFESIDIDLENLKNEEDDLLDSVMELPRIVIWTDEELLRPSAIEVIRFHEENGVPLFHISPDKLRNSFDGKLRALIGRTSLIVKNKSGYVHKKFHNSKSGAYPMPDDYLDENSASEDDYRMKIWGSVNGEDLITSKCPKEVTGDLPIHEFKYLVNHEETLFACDAWLRAADRALSQNGSFY